MGSAAGWRPQSQAAASNRIQRNARPVLARRRVARVYLGSKRPARSIPPEVSTYRRTVAGLYFRRLTTPVAGRRKGTVLSGDRRYADGGGDPKGQSPRNSPAQAVVSDPYPKLSNSRLLV